MRVAPDAVLRWTALSIALGTLTIASPSAAQPATEPGADAQTGIHGRIVAGDTGEGLLDAPVLVEGRGRVRPVLTDDQGAYRLSLPPGRYIVRSYFDMYHGARLAGVQVQRGRVTEVNLTLDPIEAEEIVVEDLEVVYRADTTSALAQQNLRRETVGAVDAISAAEISRNGDSNAAAAARRVVGVTVDDANMLVVRGLGGRYSAVLMNGVLLPSTDPDNPGVQLDIFPVNLLASMSISKTFRPDLPGSWAGGIMELGTRAFPDHLTLRLRASTGVNTMSTVRDRLDYQGGRLDFLGFDDGTRRIPSGVPDQQLVNTTGLFTSAQITDFGKLFPDIWQYRRRAAPPNASLGLTFGNTHRFDHDRRLGYLFSFDYNSYQRRTTGLLRPDVQIAAPGAPPPCEEPSGNLCEQSRYSIETGQLQVFWGTLANVSLALGEDHEITALSFFNRNTTDSTTLRSGFKKADGASIESWRLQFVGRSIFFNQLLGDHRNLFGTRLRLRWNAVASTGRREEPDTRTVLYRNVGGEYRWFAQDRSGQRYFSDLRQSDVGGGASLRFPLWSAAWATLGTQITASRRDFTNRNFQMDTRSGMTDEQSTLPAELLFCNDCQDVGLGYTTSFGESSLATSGYGSNQRLYAMYFQLETPLGERLKLLGGARLEIYQQDLSSQSPWPGFESTTAPLQRTAIDPLPAVQLVYQVNDAMYLRAGYGETVSRPQARELAPFQYYDFIRSRLISGNPELERTHVHNADLRWEWFFGTRRHTTELLAVSLFYKEFLEPIELQVSGNPENLSAHYINALGARNFGAEIEGRLDLGRIHRALRLFSIQGNLAILYSRVRFSAAQAASVTNKERPLFGQSPYVANLSLRFDEPDAGIAASLVYNVIGPRIVSAGVIQNGSGTPDQTQQAFHSLDIIASWRANPHLDVKLKAQNLLFQSYIVRSGSMVTQLSRMGASFTVGLDIHY